MDLNDRQRRAPLGVSLFDSKPGSDVADIRKKKGLDDESARARFWAYTLALLLGVVITLNMIPLRVILSTDSLDHPVAGDVALNVVGQRYFVADSWRWPLLTAKSLVTPE